MARHMLTENRSPNWGPKRSRLGALPIVLLLIFVILCFCQGGNVTPIAFSIPTEIILSDDEDDDLRLGDRSLIVKEAIRPMLQL